VKILITGAAGRIGRAIHAELAPHHDAVGLDRRPGPAVRHVGELDDVALLRSALRDVEAVVHVAALHAPQVGAVPDAEFQRVNVDATRQLVALAGDLGVRRVVYTSTTALYGRASTPVDRAGWIDEASEPVPLTIYHRSKLAAEAVLRAAADAGGPSLRILRMSRCFPEPAPVMACYRLHRGIDARDVASAHALALSHPGPASACFVVSGATPFERDDAYALKSDAPQLLRHRAPALVAAFTRRGWPLPLTIDRVYDASAAQRELGWRPRCGYDEVLAQYDARSAEVLRPDPTG
jgi:nucleoside-diphosphate-sugar epimerase